MKLITIILLLISSTFIFAQNKEHKEYYGNGKIRLSGYVDGNGKQTGEAKEYDENGILKTLSHFKDGEILDGTTYFSNGKIQSAVTFKNGKINGETKNYYENGNLAETGSYKDGKPVGEWKEYYESGKLAKVINISSQEIHSKSYYESGNLESEGRYQSDEETKLGEWKDYYENGKLKQVANYNGNQMNLPSKVKKYDENGKVTFEN
jgi:antitoxin component YwqK of YwqJK toxin-antitoxin module